MNKLVDSSFRSRQCRKACVIASMVLYGFTAMAQDEPGWRLMRDVTPKSLGEMQKSGTPSGAAKQMLAGAAAIPVKVGEMARSLQGDPVRMFEFVRNRIDYIPYAGLLRGSEQTLMDGCGNDADQSALLIEMLRSVGYEAEYACGTMYIPVTSTNGLDAAHWLDVEPSYWIILNCLSNNGVSCSYSSGNVAIDRVWVSATIDGETYDLDPAFKPYAHSSGLDLSSLMGYSRSSLLSAAGGQVGNYYVVGLNETGLVAHLNARTTSLISQLRTNYPNLAVADVLGGRTIVEQDYTALPEGLPFYAIPSVSYDELPESFDHTLQIQHPEFDQTFTFPEILGKKLAVTYTNEGAELAGKVVQIDTNVDVWAYCGTSIVFEADFQVDLPITMANVSITGPDMSRFEAISFYPTNVPAAGWCVVKFRYNPGSTPATHQARLLVHCWRDGEWIDWDRYIYLTGHALSRPRAQLRLDDVVLAEGALYTNATTKDELKVTINHPSLGDPFTNSFTLTRDSMNVILTDCGGAKSGRYVRNAERHRADLDEGYAAGGSDYRRTLRYSHRLS
jgi:hypothetical protein